MPQLYQLARRLVSVQREQQIRWLWSRFVPVQHRSDAENVYHCCVWKTASQWIRNVFSATDVYRYSGLLPYAYEQHEGRDYRALQERTFDRPFRQRRIITPLYINYGSFAGLPKPGNYRAFFVARDPRDLVVSHYFSSKFSHVKNQGVLKERSRIADLPERDGMVVHLRYMAERGIFDALRSWVEHSHADPRIRIFRFEELVGPDQLGCMAQLLNHCDIRVPREKLKAILDRLSFERLSGGRKPGEENKHHKYRSGKHGDWMRYFDDTVTNAFDEVAAELPRTLGYN
jgi:Sulfotransferase domain